MGVTVEQVDAAFQQFYVSELRWSFAMPRGSEWPSRWFTVEIPVSVLPRRDRVTDWWRDLIRRLVR